MKNLWKKIVVFLLAFAMVLGVVPLSFMPNEVKVSATEFATGALTSEFSGGTGLKDAPYLISTPEQFAYLRELCVEDGGHLSRIYFALANDIDISEMGVWYTYTGWVETDEPGVYTRRDDLIQGGWESIGDNAHPFGGCFDGRGHTITGLNIDETAPYDQFHYNVDYRSLFGRVTGDITNLNVSGQVNFYHGSKHCVVA